MMNGASPTDDHFSDAELLRAYLDPATDDDGEAFNTIYCRYRNEVRRAMEREGLSAVEAENRLGSVFIKALDVDPSGPLPSLPELLGRVARQVARDPKWKPL
jgi:hypothetical protein